MRTGKIISGNIDQYPNTGYLRLPNGTLAERPASPLNGMMRYSTTANTVEYYMANSWIQTAAFSQRAISGYDGANSEVMTFTVDASRGSKNLSIESSSFVYTMNSINADDWFLISNQVGSDAGVVMPYAGTVVRATFYCTSAFNNRKNISVYVNDTEFTAAIYANGLATSGTLSVADTNINVDFAAGNKIRARSRSGGATGTGNLQNVVLTLHVKWRY